MTLPDPTVLHPMEGMQRLVLLKPLVRSPPIEVGEFTYYDDPDRPLDFETRNVLHHYGPERLVIGRFCAIATGTTFVMNGANHRMSGVSTFPFPIMGGSWADHVDLVSDLPSRGDTVVGHDVWLGSDVTVMPGVQVGSGAVIATGSVLTSDVPPYAIVGGNPARVIKMRFSDSEIETLLSIAWWDWPLEIIDQHVRLIADGRVDELVRVASRGPIARSTSRRSELGRDRPVVDEVEVGRVDHDDPAGEIQGI